MQMSNMSGVDVSGFGYKLFKYSNIARILSIPRIISNFNCDMWRFEQLTGTHIDDICEYAKNC